jgi:hypothetical protein
MAQKAISDPQSRLHRVRRNHYRRPYRSLGIVSERQGNHFSLWQGQERLRLPRGSGECSNGCHEVKLHPLRHFWSCPSAVAWRQATAMTGQSHDQRGCAFPAAASSSSLRRINLTPRHPGAGRALCRGADVPGASWQAGDRYFVNRPPPSPIRCHTSHCQLTIFAESSQVVK